MSLRNLESDLSSKNPYELCDRYLSYILDATLPTYQIKKGQRFHRARKGCLTIAGGISDCDIEFTYPYYGSEIAAPPPMKASSGRFNREGTSFLYLSSSIATCISEIHLEVGQICSISTFECVSGGKYLHLAPKADSIGTDEDYLYQLLTQPVYTEVKYKYLITQFLSEILRTANYSGIVFKSTQSNGKNVVCFNPADYAYVEYSERMYRATKIKYSFEHVPEDYTKYQDYRSYLSDYNEKAEEQRKEQFEHIGRRIDYDDAIEFEKLKQESADASDKDEQLIILDKIVEKFKCVPSFQKQAYYLRGDYKLREGEKEHGILDYLAAWSWRSVEEKIYQEILTHIREEHLLPEDSDSDLKALIEHIHTDEKKQIDKMFQDAMTKLHNQAL